MEELIKLMKTPALVQLINETADPYSSRFPYIMDMSEDEGIWEQIQESMGAYGIACAVENGRFRKTDRYLIAVEDGPIIYTFSDNATLFEFIAPAVIAQNCRDLGIELTINATKI